MKPSKAEWCIKRGYSPTGRPIRKPEGETCGTCAHVVETKWDKVYFKCAKWKVSNSSTTDIRKKWPACILWEAAE